MMLATTKLTFWVLIIPIIILIISDVTILWYHETIDVSASIATIVVLLLVWERLRNSLLGKLDYLHDNYFFELYQTLRQDIFHLWINIIESANQDLKKYGKFIGISLYPRGMLKNIDKFLISYEKFNNRLMKIDDIGKKCCEKQFDKHLWHHLLGIHIVERTYLQGYLGTEKFKLHEDKADTVGKEHAKLIEETKNLIEEGERMRKGIFENLEHFFKSNNLRLEAESVHM